jgi:hypothetical protein
MILTREKILSVLDYCPDTGFFVWRVSRGTVKAGYVAGTIQTGGGGRSQDYKYLAVKLFGKQYAAHRIAYYLMTGIWPDKHVHIDHKDGSTFNNRWENLEAKTHTENQWNRGVQKNNRLGVRGVVQVGNRFRAKIEVHGKRIHLGSFSTPEEASAAYTMAREIYHGVGLR